MQRLLSERRIFIPCFTIAFAVVLAGFNFWLFDLRSVSETLLVVVASLGGGWLAAIYMWHLNDAAAHAWDPWVTPKVGRENESDKED